MPVPPAMVTRASKTSAQTRRVRSDENEISARHGSVQDDGSPCARETCARLSRGCAGGGAFGAAALAAISAPPRRDHIVQRVVGAFEEALDAARGLADALLVLDQREAHIIVAVLAEADARRDRDIGLLDQQLGEFEAAEMRGTSPAPAPRRTSRPWAREFSSRPARSFRPSRRGGSCRWRAFP